ncbi:MAG: pyridoxal-dependent decarboxylase [Acidimicrobiia bacterium]|nr:pyridoxal-dependent decarboxylase [Acidimicrobiia bacterium]
MSLDLESRLAARAVDYLLDPPTGDDKVIDFSAPEELLSLFDGVLPIGLDDRTDTASDQRLVDAVDLVLRHSVHTSHPRFLNQNFAGPDPIAVVGDWLGAALNTTAATFEAAPVFTLMENAVLHKLARLAGYPVDPSEPVPALPPGLFCPGGSTGTLYALQLARHRHQPDVITAGAGPDRLRVFVSAAGHYAATKSAALLGLGTDAVVEVAADHDGAMIPDDLATAVRSSIDRGATPLAVIGTAGTTVTSAFDDLNALADICAEHGIWLHVDGCYGGSALFSERHRHRLAGVERSDSFVWNLHKMMGVTQQCTALLIQDPARLGACFAANADYLFQSDKLNAEYDNGDRTFQCARRVDSLKLWLTWRARGDAGFAERIDRAVAMADHTRAAIDASDGRFAPVVAGDFTNVVFAWIPPDLRPLTLAGGGVDALPADDRDRLHRLPPAIKARMQAEGTAMVGYQPVHGLNTFRMLFMNPRVTTDDVEAILAGIDEYGSDVAQVSIRD